MIANPDWVQMLRTGNIKQMKTFEKAMLTQLR